MRRAIATLAFVAAGSTAVHMQLASSTATGIDAPRMLTALVDGRDVAALPVAAIGYQPYVALEALASDLDVAVRRVERTEELTVAAGDVRIVTIGEVQLQRASGDPLPPLSTAALSSSTGLVYVAVDDVERVFKFRAVAVGATIVLTPIAGSAERAPADGAADTNAEPDVTTTDSTAPASAIPSPPTPTAAAAVPSAPAAVAVNDDGGGFTVHERSVVRPTPAPATYASGSDAASGQDMRPRRIGTLAGTVEQLGSTRRSSLIAQATTGSVRGSAQLLRDGTTTSLFGELNVGSMDRFAIIGQHADPLAGSVLVQTATTGLGFVDDRHGYSITSVVNQFGTRSYGAQRKRGRASTGVFMVHEPGRSQLLFSQRDQTRVGEREFIISSRGVGFGLTQHTDGRFFLTATEAFASKGLPLTDGSAPLRAAVGWNASKSLALMAGYGTAYNGRPSGFVSASIRSGSAQGSFSLSPGSLTGTLGIISPKFNAMFAASSPRGSHETLFNFASTFRPRAGAGVRLEASGAASQRDVALSLVPPAARPGLVAGVEYVRDLFVRKIGPVIGVSTPTGLSGLRVELAHHPTTRGSGMRFAITQELTVRPQTWGTTVHLTGTTQLAELYIDARAPMRVSGGAARVRLTRGRHTIWARAIDGQLASEATDVANTVHDVELRMLPMVAVAGRISYDGAPGIGPYPLGGIVVALLPSGQLTTTDERGSFCFPPQPLAVGARVALQAAAVPRGIAPEASTAVNQLGETLLVLRSNRQVETVRF